jgi:hypothetical protein
MQLAHNCAATEHSLLMHKMSIKLNFFLRNLPIDSKNGKQQKETKKEFSNRQAFVWILKYKDSIIISLKIHKTT